MILSLFSSKSRFAGWRESLLGLLFPNVCQVCHSHSASREEGYVCTRCWSGPGGVTFITEPYCETCGLPFEGDITHAFTCANCQDQAFAFRSARAAVRMSNTVQEVIHKYKYNYGLWFEPFLADLLLRAARPHITPAQYDLLVPIPLHWRKKYQRQYNQAERLARAVSRHTRVPVAPKALKRTRPTPTQTRLTRKERTENVKGAFKANPKICVKGLRIVILDDVLTTGATASECAKVLIANGAAQVDVWTVARGMLR
jgi:ComF family protein